MITSVSDYSGAESEQYIASGGVDGDLKLWRLNGEFVHSISHGTFITAMATFQDTLGGKCVTHYRCDAIIVAIVLEFQRDFTSHAVIRHFLVLIFFV
jgi:WD40 repeat protein